MISGGTEQASGGATPTQYMGADRRALAKPVGSSVGFLSLVTACLGAIFVTAILIGQEVIEINLDSALLTTGLAAGAVVLVLSAGLIAAARHVNSSSQGNLDLAVLMILVGAGWLTPLRLVGVDRLADKGWVGPVALGTAFSVLLLTLSIALSLHSRIQISGGVIAMVAAMPIAASLTATRVLEMTVTNDSLRAIGIATLGIAACVGLIVGVLRHRWLLAFVGLQMLGIQGSEILGIEGRTGSDTWVVGAGMVAFAAGAIGLYGVVIDIRHSSMGQQAKLSETFNHLQRTRRIALEERQANQNRLHSLRSGLLAVETLVSLQGSSDGSLPDVVAMEVRRLKELTKSQPLERTVFDLAPHLRGLVELQHRQGLAATLDVPGPVHVHAAMDETVDAIHSLIHNAVRHAPGQPIMVSADYVIEDEIFVDVSISDRGPGVPGKLQKKIFERGMTTHEEGTGLGLTLAKQIAQAQGGTLSYRDRLGGGAIFTLRLPVDQSIFNDKSQELI